MQYGIGVPELDGWAVITEYPDYYAVTCYNVQELKRIDHRMAWEDAFRAYLGKLNQEKPVMVSGDLNVARLEIDLKNPGPNRGKAGFSDQERERWRSC